MPDDRLPDYAERLAALHAGLRDDFARIIAMIPHLAGARALDAGCGDGFFSGLLADHVGSGVVEALDSSPAYLDAARKNLAPLVDAGLVKVVSGDVLDLPFEDQALDVILSAHSMQSYDDLSAVLGEFRRVLKAGGVLAVLETDALHSIVLPWPPRLEIALRRAEREKLKDLDDRRGAYFPRYARELLAEAGFEDVELRPYLCNHPAPLSGALAKYVRLYVGDLIESCQDRLDDAMHKEAEAFAKRLSGDVQSVDFLSLQTLAAGRAAKPQA